MIFQLCGGFTCDHVQEHCIPLANREMLFWDKSYWFHQQNLILRTCSQGTSTHTAMGLQSKTCHCSIQEEALQAKHRWGRRATRIVLQPAGQTHSYNSTELEKKTKRGQKGVTVLPSKVVLWFLLLLWRQASVTLNWYGAGKRENLLTGHFHICQQDFNTEFLFNTPFLVTGSLTPLLFWYQGTLWSYIMVESVWS